MPLAMPPPFVVPKTSTVHPLPLAKQQKSVANGVGKATSVPNLQWWARVLVRDAFEQYLSIVVIVVPFLLFFWLVEPTTTPIKNRSRQHTTKEANNALMLAFP
jgi:hypothetical protein